MNHALNLFRLSTLLSCIATVSAPVAAQTAAETLAISAGMELNYEGRAFSSDEKQRWSMPLKTQYVVLQGEGGLELAAFHTLGTATSMAEGELRSVPATTSHKFVRLLADNARAPLPEGSFPAMSAGVPPLMAIGGVPFPPSSVNLAQGAASRAGRVVLTSEFDFALEREWKAEMSDGRIVLTAQTPGLPVAHALATSIRLLEYSERLVIDPARRAVVECGARWKLEFSADPPRATEYGYELKLVSSADAAAGPFAALREDKRKFDAAARLARGADLDAAERTMDELAEAFDESQSYFRAEARRVLTQIAATREQRENERLQAEVVAKLIGKQAVDVLGDVVGKDLSGNEVRLSALKGKVVVLNFYASWCGPCNQEFPHLKELYAKYGSDLAVIGFDKEPDETVEREHARKQGLPWPIVLHSDKVNEALLVRAFPTNYYVDRQGRIVLREVGFDGPEKLARTLEGLLKAK